MIPELLAFSSAIFWAIQITFSRKGLLTLTVTSGLMVNLIVVTVTLWLFTIIFFPTQNISPTAILVFALSGAIAPFLGRLFLFEGIFRLGSSLAASFRGIYPLFATFTAIIFLGEKITLLIFLGTLSIISGAVIVSSSNIGSKLKFRKLDISIPILGALCFGLADPIRKFGLGLLNSPILGAAIGSTTALACLTLFLTYRRKIVLPVNNEGTKYLVISGFVTSFALMTLFFALSFGSVVLVTPLSGTAPLFVLIFSHVFLKQVEKVTPFLVIGAIVIVLGSALVAIG